MNVSPHVGNSASQVPSSLQVTRFEPLSEDPALHEKVLVVDMPLVDKLDIIPIGSCRVSHITEIMCIQNIYRKNNGVKVCPD